jgi:hypothetical protein
MTLAVRNTVVVVGAVVAALLVLLFAIAAYQIFVAAEGSILPEAIPHTWLIWSWDVARSNVHWSLAAAGVFGAFSAVALIVSVRVFRRFSSPELYFFVIMLIALSMEQARALQGYLLLLELPQFVGMVLTRFIVVGRVIASLGLFAASLYAVGIEYPRIGSITVALAVLAFLLVYFVPVDTVELNAALIHRLGWQSSIELVMLCVSILTIGNYAIAGARGHRDRGVHVALSAASVVIARDILYFVPSLPWLILSLLLMAYGTTTFILITREHFLWS